MKSTNPPTTTHVLLQHAFTHASIGVILFDASLRLVFANEAARTLLELTNSVAPIGSTMQQIFDVLTKRGEYLGAGGEEQARARMRLALDGQEVTFERPRPNGRWLESRYIPLAGGGAVQVYSDMTHHIERRWRMEAQVLDLRTRVKALEAELAARGG